MIKSGTKSGSPLVIGLGICLLWALCVSGVSASPNPEVVYSEGCLTVDATKAPLLPLLESIACASGIEFLVSKDIQPRDVSIRLDRLPIESAVKKILDGFSHLMIFDSSAQGGRLRSVKVYPKGTMSGPLLSLKREEDMSRGMTAASRSGDQPSTEVTQQSTFHNVVDLGPKGLLVPGRYSHQEEKDGFLAVVGKRFEIQEQKAFTEIAALKSSVAETQDEEEKAALDSMLVEKLTEFHNSKLANQSKMESLYRIELFNQTKNHRDSVP